MSLHSLNQSEVHDRVYGLADRLRKYGEDVKHPHNGAVCHIQTLQELQEKLTKIREDLLHNRIPENRQKLDSTIYPLLRDVTQLQEMLEEVSELPPHAVAEVFLLDWIRPGAEVSQESWSLWVRDYNINDWEQRQEILSRYYSKFHRTKRDKVIRALDPALINWINKVTDCEKVRVHLSNSIRNCRMGIYNKDSPKLESAWKTMEKYITDISLYADTDSWRVFRQMLDPFTPDQKVKYASIIKLEVDWLDQYLKLSSRVFHDLVNPNKAFKLYILEKLLPDLLSASHYDFLLIETCLEFLHTPIGIMETSRVLKKLSKLHPTANRAEVLLSKINPVQWLAVSQ